MSKKITIDGNTAASHVAYAFSDCAAIYPITPSTPMAEIADEWAAEGKLNMFGQPIRMAEMQSEGGAAGAVHGSLVAGALTTTFTASQGLLLMIPNMYKIAGELLPTVFHVSARAIAAGALSIFGDHQDVMACRQTGFGMISSNNVQEAMDLALVAHLATLEARVPFVHFFDGFRTSHEISKVEEITYEEMASLVEQKYIDEFRARALNPEHPHQQGTAQNPDIYFQNREAVNKYYAATPAVIEKYMKKVSKLTGRKYNLFDYVGAKDATNVIIMMGSGADACEETVNYLVAKGKKTGLIKVRLYRPFSVSHLVKAIPSTVETITVLDRTKEAGSLGEPLYLDVVAALKEANRNDIKVVGGRYGLGSKEFTPSCVMAVIKNATRKTPKNHFTVGINDDVTNTSLEIGNVVDVASAGTTRCKFYGLGSDGTVGANKNSIKIIGDHTDLYAQGYFVYDSKKSGGITVSHLRFGKSPIRSSYLIDQAEFIACHNPSYVTRYDMLSDAKEGGTFLLNCHWSIKQLEQELPATMKNQIATKKLKFYIIDGLNTAKQAGSAKSTNMVMQAAFFKLANIIPYAKAEKYMKAAVVKTYGKKGEAVIKSNYAAIDNAITSLVEVKVPASWATTTVGAQPQAKTDSEYFENFVRPIINQKGDSLAVSAFDPSGVVPTSTSKYEKRGIAVEVPVWVKENCIQCNQCSFVCPHAVIRPVLIDAKTTTPKTFETIAATGMKDTNYRMQISQLDCTGCASCANVCPAKNKALVMKPTEQVDEIANYEFSLKVKQVESTFNVNTVKGSQFKQPLFEFSGACTGCGETPYIKLITQLFGDRMVIANATGCSSIYGGSAPTCPYTVNADGHGPAWANSLFEDNAEFGYGFNLAYTQRRLKLRDKVIELAKFYEQWAEGKAAIKDWLDNYSVGAQSKRTSAALLKCIEGCMNCGCEADKLGKEIYADKDLLVKKSIWAFGGDGWAYDIGYGGLDHVLASGEDVNILVMDTEVYSNTGGQASKASPTGAVAKFTAAGKRTKKKDLGLMAMSYGYVYVAQVGMGANQAQLIKAISEAEAYNGPSIIIAYAPCINHGIDMSNTQEGIKQAVECGYWALYRYNPQLENEGKNPFVMDSKAPTASYQDFIRKQTRYSSLLKTKPQIAEDLFKRSEEEALERVNKYIEKGSN